MSEAENFFTEQQKAEILQAVKDAEKSSSGEIRLFIEDSCPDALERSAEIFATLEMHKTALRNGVLFYLATGTRKFAIIGDTGINKLVPNDFWNSIKQDMQQEFRNGNFSKGLCDGIRKAGNALKQYFPNQGDNDVNELPDDIVFG